MILALSCMHVSAQNGANRMIVVNKDGSKSGYVIESIDSVFFAKMPGTASVNLTAGSLIADDLLNPMVRATIKKEGLCQSFRYTVVPKAEADAMVSDADVINYFNTFASKSYTEDLNDEILRNVILSRGTTNTILAVAYDEYNVACSASKADFEIPGDFEVSVSDVKNISIFLNVTPSDESMNYFIRCEEKEKIDAMSDKDIFEMDKAYFTKMAEDYQSSIQDVLSWNVQVGTQQGFELSGYKAGTDYVVYIYGVDTENYKATTGIVRVPVHTLDVEMTDAKFDIAAEVVDGFYVDATFTPVNYDGHYSFDVIEVDENMNDDEIESMIEGQWAEAAALYFSFGYGADEILAELCTTGETNMMFQKEANKTYVAYAYAINSDAMLCSDVVYKKVKTGDVPRSDNTITISMEKVTPYNALINFTSSNYGEEYAVYAAPASEFEGLEGDALLQYIVDQYPITFTSDMQIEVAPLLPNKLVRVFAYGCVAGAPTTDLFEMQFETPEPIYNDALTGKLSYGKYYDSKAVAELDYSYNRFAKEGVAFIPVDLTQSEDAQLYTAFFSDVDLKGKTDEDLVSWMMYNPDKYLTNAGTKYNILRAPYEMEITGVSFEVASDGTFSKLYRGEKLIVRKGYESDPQEFVDNYPIPVKTCPAQVKGNTIKKSKNLIKADPAKIVKHNITTAHADKIKNLKLRK